MLFDAGEFDAGEFGAGEFGAVFTCVACAP